MLDHDGAWTEDAFLALAHEGPPGAGRVELVEGALLIGPGSTPEHQKAVGVVCAALAARVPDGLRACAATALRLGRDCLLVPDVVITRAPAGAAVLDSGDVLMVVDVVGTPHGIVARSFKPQLYARSGIPYAVLVDVDEPFAVATMVIGGRYHEYAHAGPGERLVLTEPFPLELDLAPIRG